jgi:hypothetical protein
MIVSLDGMSTYILHLEAAVILITIAISIPMIVQFTHL